MVENPKIDKQHKLSNDADFTRGFKDRKEER